MKLITQFDYNPTPDDMEHIELCDFAWRDLFFNVDGSVQVCCGNNPILKLETEEDIEYLWNGDIFQKLRKAFLTKKNLPSFCRRCDWFKTMSNKTSFCTDNRKIKGEWITKLLPQSVNMNITDRCNLRCTMCGKFGKSQKDLNNELSFEMIKSILEKYGTTCDTINICTDGEFLLHSRIDEILNICNEIQKIRGRRVLFGNTNGLLFRNKKVIKKVIDIYNEIRFSVDTIDPKLYKKIRGADVSLVKDAIKKCVKYRNKSKSKCRIGISAVLMQDTLYGIEEFVDFAVKEELDTFHCQHMIPNKQSDITKRIDTSYQNMIDYNNIYEKIRQKTKNINMNIFMPQYFKEVN